MRNRNYNPATGRFLTEDPIRDGYNWYSYGNNNPGNMWDPWGLRATYLYIAADSAKRLGVEAGFHNTNSAEAAAWRNMFVNNTGSSWQAFIDIEEWVSYYTANLCNITSSIVHDTINNTITVTMSNDSISVSRSYNIGKNEAIITPDGRIFVEAGEFLTAFLPVIDQPITLATTGETVMFAIGAVSMIKGGYWVYRLVSDAFARTNITSNLGNTYNFTPSANHSTTKINPGYKGTRNSSIDIIDDAGDLLTHRWFDSKGRAIRDIDMTNHGNPKTHPEWPHQHIWRYRPDGIPLGR